MPTSSVLIVALGLKLLGYNMHTVITPLYLCFPWIGEMHLTLITVSWTDPNSLNYPCTAGSLRSTSRLLSFIRPIVAVGSYHGCNRNGCHRKYFLKCAYSLYGIPIIWKWSTVESFWYCIKQNLKRLCINFWLSIVNAILPCRMACLYLSACATGTYKWTAGNSTCTNCPAHSDAVQPGSVECRCVPGYYRNPDDDKALNCTR